MNRFLRALLLFPVALLAQPPAQTQPSQEPAKEETPVFRSDVSLMRVDVQVLDRDNRAVANLQKEDFVLREGGRKQEIRNFLTEDMPLDVLFLFDVSRSMSPHVRRVTDAAQQSFRILNRRDRVAVMVFDRATRVRMPFRSKEDGENELRSLIRQERFNGGTDITRAMLDAADYVRRNGRRDARRAIIIVTDDETEFDRDDERVSRSLIDADAVLMALLAPNAMPYMSGGGYPGGGYPGGGRGYPGGYPPRRRAGGLGGVILGPGYPGGGGGYPGGGGQRYPQGGPQGGQGGRTRSAGTAEIARESGGDSLPVDHASALEDTLQRIRQRYALHFLLPGGLRAGQQRSLSVELAPETARRFQDAELRYRHTYVAPSDSGPSDPVTYTQGDSDRSNRADRDRDNDRNTDDNDRPVLRRGGSASRTPSSTRTSDRVSSTSSSDDSDSDRPIVRRRTTSVGEPGGGGTRGPNPAVGAASDGQPSARPADPATGSKSSTSPGWRRVKPEELPPDSDPAKKKPEPEKKDQ